MGMAFCFLSIGELCCNPVQIFFFSLATGCYNKNFFLWDIAKTTSMGLFSSIVPLAFPSSHVPIL